MYPGVDAIESRGIHVAFVFLQVLVALACDLGLDLLPCCADRHEWAWFRRFCMASRLASSLETRMPLPDDFLAEAKEKISEVLQASEECGAEYTDHTLFKREHDEQLLLWLQQ